MHLPTHVSGVVHTSIHTYSLLRAAANVALNDDGRVQVTVSYDTATTFDGGFDGRFDGRFDGGFDGRFDGAFD